MKRKETPLPSLALSSCFALIYAVGFLAGEIQLAINPPPAPESTGAGGLACPGDLVGDLLAILAALTLISGHRRLSFDPSWTSGRHGEGNRTAGWPKERDRWFRVLWLSVAVQIALSLLVLVAVGATTVAPEAEVLLFVLMAARAFLPAVVVLAYIVLLGMTGLPFVGVGFARLVRTMFRVDVGAILAGGIGSVVGLANGWPIMTATHAYHFPSFPWTSVPSVGLTAVFLFVLLLTFARAHRATAAGKPILPHGGLENA